MSFGEVGLLLQSDAYSVVNSCYLHFLNSHIHGIFENLPWMVKLVFFFNDCESVAGRG